MEIMNPFSFELPTRIEYGIGAVEKLGNCLDDLDAKKVLIVTDEGILQSGLAEQVLETIKNKGLESVVFSGVEPNPKDHNVHDGAEAAQHLGADCIIAVGGGSPIDCAKGIALVAATGGKIRDYQDPSRITRGLPLIAIPTTAGTGSEVTFGSVITDTSENFKFTVKSPLIGPAVALVDPKMTITMPPALTAATGMDALTHAVEGYTARKAEPIADALGLYAIELISKYLRRAYNQGDNLEARSGMLLGSIIAGMCFSHSDVASVHCIAEALGGKYDLPHGVCNAVVLAPMMKYNMDYCREKYALVAKAMGFNYKDEEEGCQIAVEEVAKLARDVELPPFRDLGAKKEDLEEIAIKSAKNGSNMDNPRPMEKDDYLKFLVGLFNSGQ